MTVMDLAKAIGPDCEIDIVGIRPGEKLHEVMIPEDDAYHAVEHEDYFAILPTSRGFDTKAYLQRMGGTMCADGFCYSSDNNKSWLSLAELRAMAGLPETNV